MYKFEFIIPKNLIQKIKIINLHGGNLLTNRGGHAVVWSVLLREKKTCLSCYELTGGIDEGLFIDSYDIDISSNDSVADVNLNLSYGIPKLLESIKRYLSGEIKAVLVTGGTYRRKIDIADYTIDIDKDTVDIIRGKVLSQVTYKGAVIIVDGTEYRVKNYANIDKSSRGQKTIEYRDKEIFIREIGDGIKLDLCKPK